MAEASLGKYQRRSYNPNRAQRAFDKLDSIWCYIWSQPDSLKRDLVDAGNLVQNLKLELLKSSYKQINLTAGWNRSNKWKSQIGEDM